ncbi:MAG: efflux RND transporter periplasmic adaptor subunit [Saprospiraceae bacterium]|nr:efflux RND transporter periplasmic adaptor subunit [Saprospiraceae bacterium]
MRASALLFIICIVVISCKKTESTAPNQPPKKPMGVEAWLVTSEAIEEKLRLPASIVANEFTEIKPELNGKILQINFKDGQAVSKGQWLFKLNDADPQARISKLRIQKEILLNTEKRQKELLQLQAIGQQEYDLALLQLRNAEADIKILETEIEKHLVRAPFSGTLGIRQISPGAVVTPSTVLVGITDLSSVKIQFPLPEKYISTISKGDLIDCKINGINHPLKAKILSSESSLDPNTRALMVSAQMIDKSVKLYHGLFAEVILDLRLKQSGMMVPTQAIIPQARDKKLVVLKNGLAEFISVELGVRDSSKVEILKGITEGDTVIISGLMGVKPKSPVNIIKLLNSK